MRKVQEQHLEVEYLDREKSWGHHERDSLRAFLNVRRDIISEYASDLTVEQVDLLARSTRGLIRCDIESCVICDPLGAVPKAY